LLLREMLDTGAVRLSLRNDAGQVIIACTLNPPVVAESLMHAHLFSFFQEREQVLTGRQSQPPPAPQERAALRIVPRA